MTTDGPNSGEPAGAGPATADETEIVAALRRGGEQAFIALIDRYHRALVRLAQLYVPSQAVAEEVAQETWLGVLQGIHRFEGRSSLRTWIFRILTNRAKTRGEREGRSVAFSALGSGPDDAGEPAVEPDRFRPPGAPLAGHWASPPRDWGNTPEERLLAAETLRRIRAAIELLPPAQRQVITMRDVEGWTSEDVCNILQISETNQRVLLHRARSKVRRALEAYLNEA